MRSATSRRTVARACATALGFAYRRQFETPAKCYQKATDTNGCRLVSPDATQPRAPSQTQKFGKIFRQPASICKQAAVKRV